MMLLTTLKNWFSGKKNPFKKETGNKRKKLDGPFCRLEDFEVGDLVTTKPGVCPGGRTKVPVEEVGPMLLWGEIQPAVRVKNLPYLPEELILEKKRDKIKNPILGLWE